MPQSLRRGPESRAARRAARSPAARIGAAESELDEVKAGLGALLLGEHVLAAAARGAPAAARRSARPLGPRAQRARSATARPSTLDDGGARRTPTRRPPSSASSPSCAAVSRESALRAEGGAGRRAPDARFAVACPRRRRACRALARPVARAVETAEEAAAAGARDSAPAAGISPGRQIELGRRLARNPKLQRLAALVGRMRAAGAARCVAPRCERASEEVFDVELGRDAGSPAAARAAGAAPSAAAARLPAPPGRGTAALLPLRGTDERGRGPMIVCLDGCVVDGGRQGDLVEGRRADAARDRAPPAPAVPLRSASRRPTRRCSRST